MTQRPDWQQQRDFLIRMYFGADDEQGGFTKRAYLDLNRTIHGLSKVADKEERKARATECLRDCLSNLKAKTVPSSRETLGDEFDEWHAGACNDIAGRFGNFLHGQAQKRLNIGQAQKWLNMTIKYRWFFSESDPLNGWSVVVHIPVDDFVLRAAKAHGIVPPTQAAWSRWDLEAYQEFQKRVRGYAEKCNVTPLELEHRWWMNQSGFESPVNKE
jgi:hypothetical protein